jgi:hypothetical protein
MATEMVLIPKTTYERLQLSDKVKENGTFIDNKDLQPQTASLSSSSVAAPPPAAAGEQAGSPHPPSTNFSANLTQVSDNDKIAASENETIASTLLDKFKPSFRLYAKRLLIYIKKHGGNILEWTDDDNAFVYKGHKVEGSNIYQLIMHVFRTNRHPPSGVKQFIKAVGEIRVPKAFLKPYMLKPPGIPKSIKNKWIRY